MSAASDDSIFDLSFAVEAVKNDPGLLNDYLDGISPVRKPQKVRETSQQVLMQLAQDCPDLLLPHWDEIMALLESGNGFSAMAAVHLIAGLVPADVDGRFDVDCRRYFALLNCEHVSVAAHVAGLAAGIVAAKPHLLGVVTEGLLAIDPPTLPVERRDLIRAYAVETFSQLFDRYEDPAAVLTFVAGLRSSSCNQARKAANTFWKTHSAGER